MNGRGIPDNYDMWEAHERALENALKRRPRCVKCKEHIQDDCYCVNGDDYCEDCLKSEFRREIDDAEFF